MSFPVSTRFAPHLSHGARCWHVAHAHLDRTAATVSYDEAPWGPGPKAYTDSSSSCCGGATYRSVFFFWLACSVLLGFGAPHRPTAARRYSITFFKLQRNNLHFCSHTVGTGPHSTTTTTTVVCCRAVVYIQGSAAPPHDCTARQPCPYACKLDIYETPKPTKVGHI